MISALGPKWPLVSALLVLDFFAHPLRAQLLQSAGAHRHVVWVLLQHKGGPDDPDLSLLRSMQALLYVVLPKKSAVLHKDGCWEEAPSDVHPSRYTTQLWKISVHPN